MAAIETSVRATTALDDLYRRHVGDVYRYAYAVLGNHADAEDVTQTTFVNALRALERGEQPRNAANWLIVIAHNIVRQRWRQAAARPTEVELVNDVPDEPEEDDVELEGLVRALQRIPPSQREALVMRELEGRSYQEISELLGLTTSALETLLFRARRSLAEELENLVTCQSAELAISRRLDKRLSRKESRRLDEHLAECTACAKLAATQARQRRAFKGLALLPLPIGLELFKGAPSAAAASLPTIGTPATTGGLGTASATSGATGAGGAATGGGVAVGGSLIGGAVAKVAAVLIAGVVVTGAAYKGAQLILDTPGEGSAAAPTSAVEGAFRSTDRGADASTQDASTEAASAGTTAVAAAAAQHHPGRAATESETDLAPAGAAPDEGSTATDTPATSPGEPDAPAATPPADGPTTQPEQPGTTTTTATATTTTTTVAPSTTTKQKKKAKKHGKTTPAGPKAKKQQSGGAQAGPKGPDTSPSPNGSGSSSPSNAPSSSDSPKTPGPDAKTQPAAGSETPATAPESPSATSTEAAAAADGTPGSGDGQGQGSDKSPRK